MAQPVILMAMVPREKTPDDLLAAWSVMFESVLEGQKLELAIYQCASANDGSDERKLLGIKGSVYAYPNNAGLPLFAFSFDPATVKPLVSSSQTDPSKPIRTVAFRFGDTPDTLVKVVIPTDKWDTNEGDTWVFQLRIDAVGVKSPKATIARIRRQLPVSWRGGQKPKATYDWHMGNKIELFHDGSKGPPGADGAFVRMLAAMKAATRFIFIADWSFHPGFRVDRTKTSLDSTIGRILATQATNHKDMLIAIHTWDHTVGSGDEQNDWGERRLTQFAGGSRPDNLLWRKSSRTGFGFSHHQKFVVCDCPGGPDGNDDVIVFFGGLDITKGRFDWPDHVIGPAPNPAHPAPPFADFLASFKAADVFGSTTYDDWYSAEFDKNTLPKEPWHDIYGWLQGPTAWSVIEEFVGRWMNDPAAAEGTSAGGNTDKKSIDAVRTKFNAILDPKLEPKLTRQYEGKRSLGEWLWSAQVYRSLKKEHWAQKKPIVDPQRHGHFTWTLPQDYERSIQDAYEQAIDQADKFIYIETQYFIGSGKRWRPTGLADKVDVGNDLPERIVNRIKYHKGRGEPFHVYVFTPMYPEGNPADHGPVAQREYEWATMEYMIRALGDDWQTWLTFGFLGNGNPNLTIPTPVATKGGSFTSDTTLRESNVIANKRYMVYIHSKLMIVDDRYIIFGSANLNERSLNGARDSEICIAMWPGIATHEDQCIKTIKDFRTELFLEHIGHAPTGDAWTAGCVSDVQSTATNNYRAYRMGGTMSGHLMRWPLKMVSLPDNVAAYSQATLNDPDAILNCSFIDTVDSTGPWLRVDTSMGAVEGDEFLPDSPNTKDEWRLWSPGNWAVVGLKIPE